MLRTKLARCRIALLVLVLSALVFQPFGARSGKAFGVSAQKHYLLATTYLEGLDEGRAIEELHSAIEMQPDFAAAYCKLGEAYHLQHIGRHLRELLDGTTFDERPRHSQEEMRAYEDALRVDPTFAPAYVEIGKTYITYVARDEAPEESMTRAESLYLLALDIDPNCSEALYELGALYFQRGEFEEFLQAYWKALSADKDFPSTKGGLLSQFAFEQKRPDDVIAIHKAAIALNHNVAGNYLALGDLYRMLEDYSSALEAYKKSIAWNPDNVAAHDRLGNLYLKTGDKAAAIDQGSWLMRRARAQTDFLDRWFDTQYASAVLWRASR